MERAIIQIIQAQGNSYTEQTKRTQRFVLYPYGEGLRAAFLKE